MSNKQSQFGLSNKNRNTYFGEDAEAFTGDANRETLSRKKVFFDPAAPNQKTNGGVEVQVENLPQDYVSPFDMNESKMPATYLKSTPNVWAPKLKNAEFFKKQDLDAVLNSEVSKNDPLRIKTNFDMVINAINCNIDLAKYLKSLPKENHARALHNEIRYNLDTIKDKMVELGGQDLTLNDSIDYIKRELTKLDDMYKSLGDYVKSAVEHDHHLSQYADSFFNLPSGDYSDHSMLDKCLNRLSTELESLLIARQEHQTIMRNHNPAKQQENKYAQFISKMRESSAVYNDTYKILSSAAKDYHALLKKSLENIKGDYDKVKNDRQRLFFMQYAMEKYLEMKYSSDTIENQFKFLTQNARRSFSSRYAMKGFASAEAREEGQSIEQLLKQLDELKEQGSTLKRHMKEFLEREKARMSKRSLIDQVQFGLMTRVNALDDEIDMAKEVEVDMKKLDNIAKELGMLGVKKGKIFVSIDKTMKMLHEKAKRDESKGDVMKICKELNDLIAGYGEHTQKLKWMRNTFLTHVTREFLFDTKRIMKICQTTRESLIWFIRREDSMVSIKKMLMDVLRDVLSATTILLDDMVFDQGFRNFKTKIFLQKVSIEKSRGFQQSEFEESLLLKLEKVSEILNEIQSLNADFKGFLKALPLSSTNKEKIQSSMKKCVLRITEESQKCMQYGDEYKELRQIADCNSGFVANVSQFIDHLYELTEMMNDNVFKDEIFPRAEEHYKKITMAYKYITKFKSEITDTITAEYRAIQQLWEPALFFKNHILETTDDYTHLQLQNYSFVRNKIIEAFPSLSPFQQNMESIFEFLTLIRSCTELAEDVMDELARGLEEFDVQKLKEKLPYVGRKRADFVTDGYEFKYPLSQVEDSQENLRARLEIYKYDLMALRIAANLHSTDNSLAILNTPEGKYEIVSTADSYIDEMNKHQIQLKSIFKKDLQTAYDDLCRDFSTMFQTKLFHLDMIRTQLEFCADDLLASIRLESDTQDIFAIFKEIVIQKSNSQGSSFFKTLFKAFYSEINPIEFERTNPDDINEIDQDIGASGIFHGHRDPKSYELHERLREAIEKDEGIAMEYVISAMYKCNSREYMLCAFPSLLGFDGKKDKEVILKLTIGKDRSTKYDNVEIRKVKQIEANIVEDQLKDVVLILVITGGPNALDNPEGDGLHVEFKEIREGFRSLFNAKYEAEALTMRKDHLSYFYQEVTRESIKKVKIWLEYGHAKI